MLSEFLLKPALRAGRYAVAAVPSRLEISGCAASANGTVLADAVDDRPSAWALPIDAESGAVRGSLASLNSPERGGHLAQFTPDGASFLLADTGFLAGFSPAYDLEELCGTRINSAKPHKQEYMPVSLAQSEHLLSKNLECLCYFQSRMGSLAAQPEVQADHFFLPWLQHP
jgi:hypothetical protein